MQNDLIGIWKTDPKDSFTQQQYGEVTIEFRENGELIYTIQENDKEQIIFLVYEVIDHFIMTDQPSSPNKELTEFILSEQGLELIYDGKPAKYLRVL
jgi:hypothetical protein